MENSSNLRRTKNLRYDISCQYAAVDEATAKVIVSEVIAAEVIICYLGMLRKWKTAVLAWFSVPQVQYEVFFDE